MNPPNDQLGDPPALCVECDVAQSSGDLLEGFLKGGRMPCWIGLSPSTSAVNRARLRVILDWVCARSDDVLVVEGSFANRWNLVVEAGCSEAEATERSREPANRFGRRLDELRTDLPSRSRVKLFEWELAVKSPEFVAVHDAIRSYAASNGEFHTAVREATSTYLERRGGDLVSAGPGAQEMWTRYMFEELAVFLLLYSMGYTVEVYPGKDLAIMQRIAAGMYPEFPISCSRRTHVGIRVTQK